MLKSLQGIVVAVALALASGIAHAGDKPLTVLELFTSQGCSSCPPADAYLGKLAQRDDILALSVHVDYWDYIGWKDMFAKPDFGTRQRKYASKLGTGYVYTPQMVVQGMAHVTGSDKDGIERLIRDLAGAKRLDVGLKLQDGKLTVKIPEGEAIEARVFLATYDARHDVEVQRGENAGHTISYYNVLRDLTEIGRWQGQPQTIDVAVADAGLQGRDGCAVLVQAAKTKRILGAAKLRLTPSS